jgi:hypothetical protein
MWSARNELPVGAIISPADLHRLAHDWFEGRLALEWKPRDRELSQQILHDAGFRGPFWSLTG